MQVWIKEADWESFVNGFLISGIDDSWNGSMNKQCMKKINVAKIEIEAIHGKGRVTIRKKY